MAEVPVTGNQDARRRVTIRRERGERMRRLSMTLAVALVAASVLPDAATGRGGSVYLDVHVPRGDLLPPGVLVASRVLSVMPTVFADERLAPWTTVTPTATRVFPEGDVLTITAPHAGPGPATARLSKPNGEIVWEGRGTPIEGAPAVQFVVALDRVGSPVCDVTVETSVGRERTTIGIVSPQAR